MCSSDLLRRVGLQQRDVLESPEEDMPGGFVSLVPPLGEEEVRPLHARAEIRLGQSEQQVMMVRHECPAVDRPAELLDDFAEEVCEVRAVGGLAEDRLPAAASAHDVVKAAGRLEAFGSSHADDAD